MKTKVFAKIRKNKMQQLKSFRGKVTFSENSREFTVAEYARKLGALDAKAKGIDPEKAINILFDFMKHFIASLPKSSEIEFPYDSGLYFQRLSDGKFRLRRTTTPRQLAELNKLAGPAGQ